MPDPTPDLNEIITSAVQARIEASVVAALSDSDTFAQYVVSALQQEVEVPTTGYGREKMPYLNHLIREAIKSAAAKAVKAYIDTTSGDLQAAVEKELKRATPELARQMVGTLRERGKEQYGIKIEFRYPDRY